MNWWSSFYSPCYGQLFLQSEPGPEVEFLIAQLSLAPGARLFDQCCGAGRLSRALARRGYNVVGVDQAEDYVAHARASCPTGDCEFFCCDALDFTAPSACDGGFNAYSSFGYFPDDNRNLAMLTAAARSLKPGAPFLLDSTNMARVLAHFQPTLVSEPAAGLRLTRHSHFDWERGLLLQHWLYEHADGSRDESRSALRLYLPHQLADLLDGAGFEPEQIYGDYDGAAFRSDSRRAIWRARKRS